MGTYRQTYRLKTLLLLLIRGVSMSVEEDALSLLRTFAAKLIQAAIRGFQQRQQFLRQRQGVKCIQRCWRRYSWHKAYINRAASRIQEAWRNRCRRKLYTFYRDLIRFREGSHPVDLLKCINPREASIIDAFSGVHLRFRFGGSSFPPTHSRTPHGGIKKRLPDRWFVDPEATARQQKAEAQQQWFHYCPKVRRQEREAASKQRKRLWMSKIYREGSQAIVHNGSVSPADMPDEEQDADIDLLQWSSALDFDNYTRSWSTLAVSTVSEVACPAEETARADSEAWTVNSVATLYNLSVPFKAAATAAAGSTSGLLHCYG
ncbi:hypothetical protein WJX82_001599 [Trebouxia sp. C0006]